MKAKNFNKKLALNKKTIVDFNNNAQKEVLGGDPQPGTTKCYTMVAMESCENTICYTYIDPCT
jgi:hypothetical protein